MSYDPNFNTNNLLYLKKIQIMKPKKLTLLISAITLLAFTTGDTKSEYYLPPQAYSVYADDIDLDGDNDIVVGHNVSGGWSGVSILLNDSNGYFSLDSFYFNGQHREVKTEILDTNSKMDLVTQYWDGQNSMIAIIYDFLENQNNYDTIILNDYVEQIETGDFNGDGYNDILVASNPWFFWGVLYNDGTGNFSLPVYYDTEFPIMDIAVGDINGDSIDDILFGGYHLEIHYGTPTGFDYQFLDFYRGNVELFDLDFDGDLDIATNFAFGQTTIFLYENTGNNSFVLHQQQTMEGTTGGFLVYDIDKDSLGDYMSYMEYALLIFYNKGDFILQYPDTVPISFMAYGAHLAKDLDNNQFEDLIFLIFDVLHILFNDGNGNFVEDPITTIINPHEEEQLIFSVFPNPIHSQATISFNLKTPSVISINLYNTQGRLIKNLHDNYRYSKGEHKLKFNPQLKPGIYILEITLDNIQSQCMKIIIN